MGGGGGGVFELGHPEGREAQAVLEIQVGSKNRAFCRGGVDFFWNNPMYNKTIIRFFFCDIQIVKVSESVITLALRLC